MFSETFVGLLALYIISRLMIPTLIYLHGTFLNTRLLYSTFCLVSPLNWTLHLSFPHDLAPHSKACSTLSHPSQEIGLPSPSCSSSNLKVILVSLLLHPLTNPSTNPVSYAYGIYTQADLSPSLSLPWESTPPSSLPWHIEIAAWICIRLRCLPPWNPSSIKHPGQYF